MMDKRAQEKRGRDLAFGWHLIHFIIAAIGMAWSLYWWQKKEPVESHRS